MGFFDSSQSQTSGIKVAPETALEQQANPMLQRQLTGLEGVVNAGPGAAQMGNAMQGTQQYADLLGQLGQGGGLLAAQQAGIQGYTDIGNQLYGGLMRQQQVEAQRQGARMGRGTNDLMLQNKLGQQRMDLVGSFAAQQAMQAPGMQAQFMGQRSEALQGLASQAMANRQALMSMGSNLREQDRAYRINTGERYNTQSQSKSGFDALTGAIGAIGGVLGGAAKLGGMANAAGGWGKMFGIGAGSQISAQDKADGDFYSANQGGFGTPIANKFSGGGPTAATSNYSAPVGAGAGPGGYDPFANLNALTLGGGQGMGLPYSQAPAAAPRTDLYTQLNTQAGGTPGWRDQLSQQVANAGNQYNAPQSAAPNFLGSLFGFGGN